MIAFIGFTTKKRIAAAVADERDRRGEERPVRELGTVDREREAAQILLAEDHRDQRIDEAGDKGPDESGEREAHHEGHRQLDDVPAEKEVAELLDHRSPPIS
jgi:hypothetical protein